MIVRYDRLDRLETPKLTLCNPGSICSDRRHPSNIIGKLIDHEAEEIVFNFNATSELNFRVNKVDHSNTESKITDIIDISKYAYKLYNSIQNRRMIFVDDIGYFVINEVQEKTEGSYKYKDVCAKSADVEIERKMIPFIENGTYKFLSDGTESSKGLLNRIVEVLPLWTINYVEPDVKERWRTFEDVGADLNCLSFMLKDMQDAYECIFIFDIIDRTINVYDQTNYVKMTDIHISNDDLIKSLSVTENADDLYTAISVLGNDNISIAALNPVGGNTIYNFDYYLDWMTPALRQKVVIWQDTISDTIDSYQRLNESYYSKLKEASDSQFEIDRLTAQIKMYKRCRENMVAEMNTSSVESYNKAIVDSGGKPVAIRSSITETLEEIDDLIAECGSVQANLGTALLTIDNELASYETQISQINDSLSVNKYFSESEYAELSNYIFEGSYNDEHVVITDTMDYKEKFNQMRILYDRAVKQLKNISKPTQEFSVDSENFIFSKYFQHWASQIETGCLINVELRPNEVAMLFLSAMTINYDDHTLSLSFGNRFNKFDPKALFDNMLGKISKTANTINYIKDIIYPVKTGELDRMDEAIRTSRNITMGAALSSDSEEVLIDESGYTGRSQTNGMYDPEQIKITGRNIVFTDDAWQTSKLAIGYIILDDNTSVYGINAETIIGNLMLGRNIRILDSNGNDAFAVMDDKLTTSMGDLESSITELEQNSESLEVRVSTVENTTHEVDHVITTTGYRFDADGLVIQNSEEEIKNLLDNTGMYVTRSGEEILTANNEGVNAINLHSRQYLIIGNNSRFENYDNGTDSLRTACYFYTGN